MLIGGCFVNFVQLKLKDSPLPLFPQCICWQQIILYGRGRQKRVGVKSLRAATDDAQVEGAVEMEGLTIGKEWKAKRGDKSTAQASLSALILQGKHLAVIAAGVGTNPFD